MSVNLTTDSTYTNLPNTLTVPGTISGGGIASGNVTYGTITYPTYPTYPQIPYIPPAQPYESLECEKIKCKDIIIDNRKISKLLELLPLTTLPEGLDMNNVTVADAVGAWYNALENLKQKHRQLLTIRALCENK